MIKKLPKLRIHAAILLLSFSFFLPLTGYPGQKGTAKSSKKAPEKPKPTPSSPAGPEETKRADVAKDIETLKSQLAEIDVLKSQVEELEAQVKSLSQQGYLQRLANNVDIWLVAFIAGCLCGSLGALILESRLKKGSEAATYSVVSAPSSEKQTKLTDLESDITQIKGQLKELESQTAKYLPAEKSLASTEKTPAHEDSNQVQQQVPADLYLSDKTENTARLDAIPTLPLVKYQERLGKELGHYQVYQAGTDIRQQDKLVEDSKGRFQIIAFADGTSSWNLALPLKDHLMSVDEYTYYKGYYDCNLPKAGEIWIVQAALVSEGDKPGVWELQKRGSIEIKR